MSTKGFAVFAAGLCLLVENKAANGHEGDRVFPIYEITEDVLKEIDVNDGFAHEWQELFEPTATALDFSIFRPPLQLKWEPSDLDFRLWMGWLPSPSRIYVALIVVDDITLNRSGGSDLNRGGGLDKFLFAVDADHSGGKLGTPNPYLVTQWYISVPDVSERGFYTSAETTPVDWPTSFPYGEGSAVTVGENPFVWHIEFYITPFNAFYSNPDESIIADLVLGETIGFVCTLLDSDGGDDFNLHYLPRIDHMAFSDYQEVPDFFADGILVGAGGGDEDDSVVHADSWARIKASFGE